MIGSHKRWEDGSDLPFPPNLPSHWQILKFHHHSVFTLFYLSETFDKGDHTLLSETLSSPNFQDATLLVFLLPGRMLFLCYFVGNSFVYLLKLGLPQCLIVSFLLFSINTHHVGDLIQFYCFYIISMLTNPKFISSQYFGHLYPIGFLVSLGCLIGIANIIWSKHNSLDSVPYFPPLKWLNLSFHYTEYFKNFPQCYYVIHPNS